MDITTEFGEFELLPILVKHTYPDHDWEAMLPWCELGAMYDGMVSISVPESIIDRFAPKEES